MGFQIQLLCSSSQIDSLNADNDGWNVMIDDNDDDDVLNIIHNMNAVICRCPVAV